MNHYMFIAFAILFGIFASIVESIDMGHCYADEDNPYFAFSTKSPYNQVHGDATGFYRKYESTCKPIQIWLFTRHGTRLPKAKQIKKMNTMRALRDLIVKQHHKTGSLCEADFLAFKDWELLSEITTDKGSKLSTQGKKDMEQLAKRLKQYLPELLETSLNVSEIYKFQSSNTSRTLDSMESFIEGLFGKRNGVKPSPSDNPDYLLDEKNFLHEEHEKGVCISSELEIELKCGLLFRHEIRHEIFQDLRVSCTGHETCTSWTNLNSATMIGLVQQEKYTQSVVFVKLVKNVAERLGFSTSNEENEYFKNIEVATRTILDIYELCRAEQSLDIINKSAWCAAFTEEQLQVLEYYEDLDYYYYVGPGRDTNMKLGCIPLKDMMTSFSQAEKQESSKTLHGVFYFSHDAPLLALLATIGLKRDAQKLTWDNYEEMEDRQFRTSKMSPFATNLAAVFYNCSSEGSPSYKVSFTLEEKPVVVEGCKKYMCEWTELQQILEKRVADCSTEWCNAASPTTALPTENTTTGGVSPCNTNNSVVLLSLLSFSLLAIRSEF